MHDRCIISCRGAPALTSGWPDDYDFVEGGRRKVGKLGAERFYVAYSIFYLHCSRRSIKYLQLNRCKSQAIHLCFLVGQCDS